MKRRAQIKRAKPIKRLQTPKRQKPLRARTPIRKKAATPKCGVVSDPAYREWVRQQPCVVDFDTALTAIAKHIREVKVLFDIYRIEGHHVGRPRNDRRMVPLYWWLHQRTPISVHSGGGNRKFQERFGIDFEAEIIRLNKLYEEQAKERQA